MTETRQLERGLGWPGLGGTRTAPLGWPGEDRVSRGTDGELAAGSDVSVVAEARTEAQTAAVESSGPGAGSANEGEANPGETDGPAGAAAGGTVLAAAGVASATSAVRQESGSTDASGAAGAHHPGFDGGVSRETDAVTERPAGASHAEGSLSTAEVADQAGPTTAPAEMAVAAVPTEGGGAETDSESDGEPVRGRDDGNGAAPTSDRHQGDAQAAEEALAAVVSRETEDTDERTALASALPSAGADTPLAQAVAADARKRIALSGRRFPKPTHTRVMTVANQKGGVGKTTTTVNVAAALAQAGLTILVIDIDPQGNASTALGIEHHAEVPSIYDVLVDGTPISEVVQECPDVSGLFCAPATIDLAGAEIELVSMVARETRLQKAIAAYIASAEDLGHTVPDYVFVDCPPSLGLLTVNAFVAADEVFIPIQCEYYALEGLSQLLKNIELIKSHLNQTLHVSTILLTMYDGRTRLSAQVAEEVRAHFPQQVLRTTVPRSVRISEAPSHGQTVMTYDPNSSGALSYLEAASELADRGAAVRAS